jgi:hypothetical protein
MPALDPERDARQRAERLGAELRQSTVEGVWFGRPVIDVVLEGEHVTDADLDVLLQFPRLQSLTLKDTGVQGPGLRTLARLPQLQTLSLWNVHGRFDRWDVAFLIKRKPGLKIEWDNASRPDFPSPLTRDLEWVQDNMGALKGGEIEMPRERRGPGRNPLWDQPVTALDLTDSRVADADLPELVSEYPDLRYLGLSGTAVTPAGIPQLARLRHLEHVALPGSFGMMDRLRLINAHPRLGCSVASRPGLHYERDLALPGAPITRLQIRELEAGGGGHRDSDKLLAEIGELDHLKEFSLTHGRLTDAGLRHVAELRRLEVLDLRQNHGRQADGEPGITGAGIRRFARPTELREIWLDGADWDTSIIPELARLPGLEILGLSADQLSENHRGLSDETLEDLATLKQLRHLDLRWRRISPEAIARLRQALPECNVVATDNRDDVILISVEPLLRRGESEPSWPRREYLLGGLSSITPADFRDGEYQPLEVLELGGCSITDQWLDQLTGRTEVRRLGLWGTRLTDDGLTVVAGLRGLTHLDLGRTAVTDGGIKRLTALPSLEWLGLDYTAVTDEGLAALADIKRLKHLSLRGVDGVTARGLDRFRAALPDCEVNRESLRTRASAT